MRFVTGGNDAKVVMVGSGGDSTKQAWPPIASVERTVILATAYDFESISYQGFDDRTYAFSGLNKSIVNNGKLTAVTNDGPTYEYRALDQKMDGATLTIETVMPPNPKNLTEPSMLVIAVKPEAPMELVGVEYGSDGVRIISLYGATLRFDQFFSYNIPVHSVIRVERFLSWIQVFVNDIRVAAVTDPTFTLVGYPGVGLYSSSLGSVSTPIGPTRFFSGSSLPRTYGGMASAVVRSTISAQGTTEILRLQVPGGRPLRGLIRNLRWRSNITDEDGDRKFLVKMNGALSTNISNSNGTSLTGISYGMVPEHAIFTIEADVSTGLSISQRQVESGTMELLPA